MAKNVSSQANNAIEKMFLDTFKELCVTRSGWQVWTDVITAIACSLANSVDREGEKHDKREAEYMECVKRIGDVDKAAQMFSYIVLALNENPEQDFLGSLFMKLDLGSHWKGQFFTPYCLCQMMAEMQVNVTDEIERRGWASINDPACGAGATLIAAANGLRNKGVNYQNHALFVAQDIDRVAALMCYIQLSILGCAGYVVVGDTLCNPLTCNYNNALFPNENDGKEIWYTPMFASDIWQLRIKYNLMDAYFNNLNKASI